MNLNPETLVKYTALQARLRALDSVVVAFSAGVDSTVLLKVAVDVLGAERVLAVTGRSPSIPEAEQRKAAELAAAFGVRHEFLDTHEFEDERYLSNPQDRCFHCKTEFFTRLTELMRQRGYKTVLSGTNADDRDDYRPGMKAAEDYRVLSPLAECGLTKAEIRAIAAELGLSVHDKPAAPCLSSRVPYGERITPEKLRRIEAGERFLHEQGFRECRVRHHENLARIEVPAAQIARFADEKLRVLVEQKFRELGFQYVSLDLRGFRSGSLNEALRVPD